MSKVGEGSTFTLSLPVKPDQPVPPELLIPGGLNRVAIEPDKVWTPPEGGAGLAFVLTAAGFQE